MARILYGVMGDSRGHLSRSLSVVEHMPQHEFLFAGGGTVLELRDKGYEVLELPMLATLYKNTRLNFTATVANALRGLLRRGAIIDTLAKKVEAFDPQLIISDYELFVQLAARRLGRPCISLDHQHVLTHCAYPSPQTQRLNRMITFFPILYLYSKASRYLISSFYELPPKEPQTTELMPPILRKAVREHASRQADHVLVYTSGGAYRALLPFLKELGRPCIVYGFKDMANTDKLTFKPYSVHGFLEDLASCRYVISNGGHNLISEALYYGKPVLCLPIHFLYEQFLNAYFLQKFGFGEYCMEPERIDQVLRRMEENLDEMVERISQFSFWGNDKVVTRLESLMRRE